jgi:hypothetical protein
MSLSDFVNYFFKNSLQELFDPMNFFPGSEKEYYRRFWTKEVLDHCDDLEDLMGNYIRARELGVNFPEGIMDNDLRFICSDVTRIIKRARPYCDGQILGYLERKQREAMRIYSKCVGLREVPKEKSTAVEN